MAQPYPPQGQQKQQTEKPVKVYAEQYLAGQPLPIGATTAAAPPVFAEGVARVYLGVQAHELHLGDWVLSSRYTGQPLEVISAEEFTERFGPSELASSGGV